MTQKKAATQSSITPQKKSKDILDALCKKKKEHAPLIEAFRPQIYALEKLLAESYTADSLPEKTEFPFFTAATIPLFTDFLQKALAELIPALQQGFPAVNDMLAKVYELVKKDATGLQNIVRWGFSQSEAAEETALQWAEKNAVDSEVLFLIAQSLAKASAQVMRLHYTDDLENILAEQKWEKGICPFCSSKAEMSCIEEIEGKRFLVCGTCAYKWRYQRTACPNCGVDKAGNITWYYIEEFKNERIEKCGTCNEYIMVADFKLRPEEAGLPLLQTLGMAYLDRLMQDDDPIQ